MKTVRTFGQLALIRVELQMIADVNAFDHKHLPILLDLADSLGCQNAFPSRNFARLQRAPEGSGQSTCCSGNNVVERGGVRFVLRHIGSVVFGDFGMHA